MSQAKHPTTADVVTQEAVESIVQAQTERVYGFRQAFREHTAGDGVGPSLKFPITTEDFEGDYVEVPEGAEYPRASKIYGDVEVVYTKYGFEHAITEEALQDGVIDLELDAMQDMVSEEASRLDAIAYNILSENLNAETGGDGGGDLTWEELIDVRAELRSQEYDLIRDNSCVCYCFSQVHEFLSNRDSPSDLSRRKDVSS